MSKYHNKGRGPRAIHTSDRGVVILQPGEAAELNVHDHDAKAIKASGLLDGDGTDSPTLAQMQAELASGATPAALTAAAPDADADDDKPTKRPAA